MNDASSRVSRVSAGPIVVTRFAPLRIEQDQVVALYEESVPRFASMTDLAAKAYLLGRDGQTGGAIYLWQSEEPPQSVFDSAWRARVHARYGVLPSVEVFDSPIRIGLLAGYEGARLNRSASLHGRGIRATRAIENNER